MVPAAPDKDARGAGVAQLADLMVKLATAGDLDGARALHETIERLLRK